MIKFNIKDSNMEYEDRNSSYAFLENEDGKLAIVEKINWGYILPGGEIEVNENSSDTIVRETLEEIGYDVSNLTLLEKCESYYQIRVNGENINCHNIADFFIGKIMNKIQEPIEFDKVLHWMTPEEVTGKLKLEFQNYILDLIYNLK